MYLILFLGIHLLSLLYKLLSLHLPPYRRTLEENSINEIKRHGYNDIGMHRIREILQNYTEFILCCDGLFPRRTIVWYYK